MLSLVYRMQFIGLLSIVGIFIVIQTSLLSTKNVKELMPVDNSLLAVARSIVIDREEVFVTVVNAAYLPLVHSWLCNTMFMGIHSRVLFIVPEVTSENEIKRMWKEVHVVTIPHTRNFTGNLDYTTAEYVRLMIFRTEIILSFLENDITVFLFEVDAMWFLNPLADIKYRLGNDDIAVVPVTGVKGIFSGGFIYLKATNETRRVWSLLTYRMAKLDKKIKKFGNRKKVPESENDQAFFTAILKYERRDLKMTELPTGLYEDGRWYNAKERSRPFIVNNNWIIGRDKKIFRAMQFKHWFWDMRTKSCDVDLVKRTCFLTMSENRTLLVN